MLSTATDRTGAAVDDPASGAVQEPSCGRGSHTRSKACPPGYCSAPPARAPRARPRHLVSPAWLYPGPVGEPNVWSVARLPAPDSAEADVVVNGLELSCAVPDGGPAEPAGATPFGLLAASLSACTAMSVRTYLQRWHIDPGVVSVRVGVYPSTPPMLDRHVVVAGDVQPELREQLASVVDSTPVTVLLRDAVTIRTVLTTGPR
jgi:putative redox protein